MRTFYIAPETEKEQLSLRLLMEGTSFDAVYTPKEWKALFQYKIQETAVPYLYQQGYSFENAKKMLSYLVYPLPETIKQKYSFLKIQDALVEKQHLLPPTPLPEMQKIHCKIMDVCMSESLRKLCTDQKVSYEILLIEKHPFKESVVCYGDAEEEVDATLTSIVTLLQSGVSQARIKLCYQHPFYEWLLFRKNTLYQLPLEINTQGSLYNVPSIQTAFEALKSGELLRKENKTEEEVLILQTFDQAKALALNDADAFQYLSFLLKQQKTKTNAGKGIASIGYQASTSEEDLVFVLGFAQGAYPLLPSVRLPFEEEEYGYFYEDTPLDQQRQAEKILDAFFATKSQKHISFAVRYQKQQFFLSSYAHKHHFLIKEKDQKEIIGSKKARDVYLAKIEDAYRLYRTPSKYQGTLKKEGCYRSFSHTFQPFTACEKKEKLYVSYSSLQQYIRCPFAYYLSRVIQLESFEETMAMRLGTAMHQYLEDERKNQAKPKEWYCNTYAKNAKEHYFFSFLFPQVDDVTRFSESFLQHTAFSRVIVEEKDAQFAIDDNTILQGKIDILFVNETQKELMIVDYKTGDMKFKKEWVSQGLSLQLPCYALLSSQIFPSYSLTALCIQTILSSAREQDEKAMNLRYQGILIGEEDRIARLDATYQKSKFFKGLSVTKEGSFSNYAPIITQDAFFQLLEDTKQVLKQAVFQLRAGNFSIQPLCAPYDHPCTHCDFYDCCFKEESDEQWIEAKPQQEDDEDEFHG